MAPFVRGRFWIWVALVITLATTCSARAERYATEDDAKPQAAEISEQVVVLQDGGVMHGHVTRSGERYILARGTGRTYIPVSKVFLVAASLDDAYQQRRERPEQSTAEGHLVLAEWCLRHDLLAHAKRELADARALEPRHDKLDLLERRLALANERQQSKLVISRESNDTQTATTPTPPVQTPVGDLPPGAVELFTRKVQPVLVNNCTTAGCHELGGTAKFQLDRATLRGMSNRRTTMSNLAATLTLVNREQPRLSPLLTAPRQTHGGMKQPVLGPRQEAAFRHLHEWVALLTAETANPSSAAPPDGTELEPSPSGRGRGEGALDAPQAGPLQPPATAIPMATQGPARYGSQFEHWQPRDPFDPEIFNRKYAPQVNGKANTEASKSLQKVDR